jgi:hypothetical protein
VSRTTVRQLQVGCASELAADALADWLTGRGYIASSDGATVRTDARIRVVREAPHGLSMLVD